MSAQAYQNARESMVQSQLHPSGVFEDRILDAYRAVPREIFVPENLRPVCYLDQSLTLENGQFLLEPMLHGKMVQRLDIQPDEKALDIGDVTGYSAAVLSHLAREVSVIDLPSVELADAKKKWLALGCHNISSSPLQESYDIILVNGAVAEIPETLLQHLNIGGRLVCVLRPSGKTMGKIAVVTREANGNFAKKLMEDAISGFVQGFEPRAEFIF